MKLIVHKIISSFLVLLVLGSTMSFSISKHYCGEHLIDVAFFSDAAPCEMEVALAAKYGPEHAKKTDCCLDEDIIIQGQDELKVQFDQIPLRKAAFIQATSYLYASLFQIQEQHPIPFTGYPPPLITQDYQVLFEQFLI